MTAGLAKNDGLARLMASFAMACAGLILLFSAPLAQAAASAQAGNGTQILEAFDRQQVKRVNDGSALTDHKKHVIIFLIGIPLIILLLITGGLGVAMGVYGKRHLFLPHMVLAGLTMTLAIVHVVVSLVWFYPF